MPCEWMAGDWMSQYTVKTLFVDRMRFNFLCSRVSVLVGSE